MATIANQYDPNNPNGNSNNGGSGTVMPPMGGGEAASGGGGGATSGSSTATPYQPPNVSQYLAANEGAGEQLTQGITSNIQNQANQLGNQQASASNTLNKQYNDLNANLNTNTANQVAQTAFQNPQQLLDAYNASKTISSNQPLSDQQQQALNQYNQFQQLNTGGYNQDIQNYGAQGQQVGAQLQNQLSGLLQQTGATQNEMGRNQLLQNAIGQGNYNQGQQTLDSLFLQGSPGQRNAGGLSNLQQLQQNLGNIGTQASQNVKGLNADIQSRLAALQGLSNQDQQLIKNLFNSGLGGIAQNVQQEVAALQQNAPREQANIQQAFDKNQFNDAQLAALGLQSGMQTWGLTPQELMAAGKFQNNTLANTPEGLAAQAASPEEFARYNALNQLAGGPTGLQSNIFGGATQAGGYNPYSFDAGALQNVLAERQKTVGQDFATALQGWQAPSYMNLMPVNEIKQGLASGSMTGDQAKARLEQWNNELKNAGVWDQSIAAMESPFTNYFNQTYAPLAASRINASTADNPLPVDNTGAIDWKNLKGPSSK